jgi:multidrug efflux pump subunit AcrA (membrane-fusion protein)
MKMEKLYKYHKIHTSKVSFIITLLFILFSSAGCASANGKHQPTPTPVPDLGISANATFTVQRGEVIRELRFRGRIEPVTQQNLYFRSSGYVRSVYVDRNASVKSGQVLADLEIGDLEKQLEQAKITVKTSETQLSTAQQGISDALIEAEILLKIEQLRLDEAKYNLQANNNTPNQIAVQIQEQQVRLAELRVERLQRGPDQQLVQAVELARLAVERLEAQVADASLTAPFDGQVLALNIRPGDSVSAYSRNVLTICDPTKLEVGADPDSEDMQELAEGMAVNISLSGQSRTALQGTVRSLPYPYGSGGQAASSEASDGQELPVRIALQVGADEGGYRIGELVEVQVILEQKPDALWLPPQAIRNFEGRKFVIIQEGDIQKRVIIITGIETEQRVEITEGLQEGQIVVGQ